MKQTKSKLLTLPGSVNRLFYMYLIIILPLLGYHSTNAQSSEAENLLILLSTSTTDSERIALMNELVGKLKSIDSKRALTYAQQSLELSQKINDKEKEVIALYNVGSLMYDSPQRDSAIGYFEDGERIGAEFGFMELQIDHLMKLGKWYRYYRVDSTKAVKCWLKSLELSKAASYNYGIGRSYAKLASFYTRYKEIGLCEKYLNLSAEYFMRLENGEEEIAHYYNEVGNKIWDYNPKKSMDFYLKGLEYMDTYPNIKVSMAKAYNTIGEQENALKYLNAAISSLRKTDEIRMLGIATGLLAEVYAEIGDYEIANKTCDEGIALLNPLGRSYQRALPAIYRTKGLVMEREGNDKAALEFYKKSLDEAYRIKISFDRVKSNLAIGNFYSSRDPEKAKKYCANSLIDAQKNNYTNLEITACDCLYNFYKNKEAYATALKYYEQKIVLNDSISTLKVEHALDINSKIAQKDKQLTEQSYQKEKKEEQLKYQSRLTKTLFISSLIGILLIGILIVSIQRISKQKKEITEKTVELEHANLSLGRSNEELERFAYVASHDLKSPLRNIISFAGVLRRSLQKEESPIVKNSLNFIESSGERMNQLIEDVLEYSKLSSQVKNEPKTINLNELVDEISLLTQNMLDYKKVSIKFSELPSVRWNYSKIFLLFKNIIENGIKYNQSEEPEIKLYCIKRKDIHLIFIEDNGIGIKKEFFDEIFIMFKRLHSQGDYDGTGLGLATCKKIVDEFEGKISISSEFGEGTTFKIEFPNHLIYEHADVEQLVHT